MANARVGALEFFTERDNGLSRQWFGNVWMNHPFSRKENHLWIRHLISEFNSGRITQACCITYACTSERWFRPLMDFPQCFLFPRTNYMLPNGKVKRGVTKGSVVTLIGGGLDIFREEFKNLGVVKV
jgi:hypothetical protein